MATLRNRVKVFTSTTGTGTITLGTVVAGFMTFANAGVPSTSTVRYLIEQGTDFEIGLGVYTASGTTLSRGVQQSKIGGTVGTTPLTLDGSAIVMITATNNDFALQTALTMIYGM
jgi:hypothetical protein